MKSIAELLDGLFVSTPSSTRRSTHTLSSHQMTATSSSGSASSSSASTSTCTSASSSSSASLEAKCPAYPTTSYGALYSEQDEQKREAMIVEHRILLHNLHACGLLAKSSLLRWEKHVERSNRKRELRRRLAAGRDPLPVYTELALTEEKVLAKST